MATLAGKRGDQEAVSPAMSYLRRAGTVACGWPLNFLTRAKQAPFVRYRASCWFGSDTMMGMEYGIKITLTRLLRSRPLPKGEVKDD
jgi:hypothetical protein